MGGSFKAEFTVNTARRPPPPERQNSLGHRTTRSKFCQTFPPIFQPHIFVDDAGPTVAAFVAGEIAAMPMKPNRRWAASPATTYQLIRLTNVGRAGLSIIKSQPTGYGNTIGAVRRKLFTASFSNSSRPVPECSSSYWNVIRNAEWQTGQHQYSRFQLKLSRRFVSRGRS